MENNLKKNEKNGRRPKKMKKMEGNLKKQKTKRRPQKKLKSFLDSS